MEQGIALLGAGRFHEALQQFANVLREQPLSPEPRIGLSQACQGIGDGWAAAAWLSDACRVAPQRADLWHGLVLLLLNQRREAEIEPLLATAITLHPQNAQLLQAQAEFYLRLKAYAPGVSAYEKLLRLKPEDPPTLMHYGFCLEQVGRVREAIDWYRKAIERQPDMMEAHVNLAGVLWRVEDFEGALEHAVEAVELAPEHPYAIRILGTALLNLNRLEEAEEQLRRALELQPGFTLAEMDLAFCLLLAGKLEEGWEFYGRRWRDTDRMKRPGFFVPALEWKGPVQQPLQGKRIAVYAEQGFGDVIQFIRYLPLMQQEGATIACIVQPQLVPLIE
ncbi:MAG TPA: tetratricopeptide repeat protein, partial [Ramlibacter sp.]|nr:tetratricopeptide repeat protein [Ramlibacter sp.]